MEGKEISSRFSSFVGWRRIIFLPLLLFLLISLYLQNIRVCGVGSVLDELLFQKILPLSSLMGWERLLCCVLPFCSVGWFVRWVGRVIYVSWADYLFWLVRAATASVMVQVRSSPCSVFFGKCFGFCRKRVVRTVTSL